MVMVVVLVMVVLVLRCEKQIPHLAWEVDSKKQR